MKSRVRMLISVVVCCFLIFSYQLSSASVEMNEAGVPAEVADKEYVKIPVYQDGEVTSVISQYMKKGDYKGYANLGVTGYAYKTGSQIKLGVVISYFDENQLFHQEFFDGVGVDNPSDVNWPSCEGAYLAVNGAFEFSGQNDNEKRLNIPFRTSTGQEFARYTEQNLLLDATYDQIKCETLSGGNHIMDTYSASLKAVAPYSNQKVFDKPLLVKKDSTINVGVEMAISSLSQAPTYQFVKADTAPTLPIKSGSWENLGEIVSSMKEEEEKQSFSLNNEVYIPNTGKQYLVLKLTDRLGVEHQVLYGPFAVAIGEAVTEIPPESNNEGNYIVPTSVSNFNATVTYETDAKDIKYTIDLGEVLNTQTTQGKLCFDVDLLRANVEILYKNAAGVETRTLLNATKDVSGKYISEVTKGGYKRIISGNTIILSLTDADWMIHSGESHTINIYFPTEFKEDINYGLETVSGSYLELLKCIKDDPIQSKAISLTISRRPKCMEAVVLDTGEVVAEAEFESVPKVDIVFIPIELRKISRIN